MKHIYRLIIVIIILLITYPIFSNYLSSLTQPLGIKVMASQLTQGGEEMNQLRVMTFNIHHGEGLDGELDLERISQLIIESGADVVGLNEVDVLLPRSGFKNQAKVLSTLTMLNYFFAPSLTLGIGQYGNGLLTRLPIIDTFYDRLPKFMNQEPRSLLRLTTEVGSQRVQIWVTHLGLNPVERQKQLNQLAQNVLEVSEPLIVMGDFNTTPTSQTMEEFLVKTGLQTFSLTPTFPADNPELKIDYILASAHWLVVQSPTPLSTNSSDHQPLVGTFRLKY